MTDGIALPLCLANTSVLLVDTMATPSSVQGVIFGGLWQAEMTSMHAFARAEHTLEGHIDLLFLQGFAICCARLVPVHWRLGSEVAGSPKTRFFSFFHFPLWAGLAA